MNGTSKYMYAEVRSVVCLSIVPQALTDLDT